MPSSYLKDIFREIKISLGRFLSILCIVAIGVAFFAGIKASAPDMKNSADMYFDTYNVQDIQIYSTLGLTKKDVKVSNPYSQTFQWIHCLRLIQHKWLLKSFLMRLIKR